MLPQISPQNHMLLPTKMAIEVSN